MKSFIFTAATMTFKHQNFYLLKQPTVTDYTLFPVPEMILKHAP